MIATGAWPPPATPDCDRLQGKYVCYLDDDDRFLPHHLRTLVTHLEDSACKVAYTDAWRVHERLSDQHGHGDQA